MAEERPQVPSPDPAPAPEKGRDPRPMTHGQQRRRQRSVFQYVAILFGAAFLLLLVTFLMERRQYEQIQEENQEQIDDLRQSVSAVQSLEELYSENAALREQVDELETQLEQSQEQAGNLGKDVIRKFERAKKTFPNVSNEEEREYLRKFAFICMLSFDVYMKKQMIESIIDGDLLGGRQEQGQEKKKSARAEDTSKQG